MVILLACCLSVLQAISVTDTWRHVPKCQCGVAQCVAAMLVWLHVCCLILHAIARVDMHLCLVGLCRSVLHITLFSLHMAVLQFLLCVACSCCCFCTITPLSGAVHTLALVHSQLFELLRKSCPDVASTAAADRLFLQIACCQPAEAHQGDVVGDWLSSCSHVHGGAQPAAAMCRSMGHHMSG